MSDVVSQCGGEIISPFPLIFPQLLGSFAFINFAPNDGLLVFSQGGME